MTLKVCPSLFFKNFGHRIARVGSSIAVFEVVSPRPKLLSDSIKSSIAVDAMFKIFKAPLTRCLFFYLKVWYEIVTVRNTKSEKVL